jgi:ATP-dependent exoDNAse (exonuclease V) alpha subunit
VEVYEADQRPLAQGDLIRMTRNQGELKNGEVGRITALMEDHATVSVKEGTRLTEHRVNLSNTWHWDHAYASTVHASQGATQHRTIFHIRAPESDSEFKQARQLEGMAKVFGDRSFYVASTRASHELSIYTNDKALAVRAVGLKQDKTSAVETIQKAENQRLRKTGVDL